MTGMAGETWPGREGIEEREDLGGITVCLRRWWCCGVAEVGKRVTEKGLGARREDKYELWLSLLEKNMLSLFLSSFAS